MRIGEIQALEWADVDFENRLITASGIDERSIDFVISLADLSQGESRRETRAIDLVRLELPDEFGYGRC